MPNQKLHDKLFRKSLSNLAIAKDFIATHVPQHVLAKFDINTIKFYKTSYVEAPQALPAIQLKITIPHNHQYHNR
ncbi:MAG: Rpn family recombination-promoting nuclease/putative transposase [Gammaproteobacteria bacterium]